MSDLWDHDGVLMIALVIDTETTGFSPSWLMPLDRQPWVMEYCGVVMNIDEGRELSRYHTLIKPPMRDVITDKARTVTGITWEDLEAAPSFAQVAGDIKLQIETAPLVIAHNVTFDSDVLDVEFKRLGLSLCWPPRLCSVEQSVHVNGERLNLEKLHLILTGTGFEAHRADKDVEALCRCLVEMRKRDWL